MPHYAGQEIAENALTPGATEDVPDESVVKNASFRECSPVN